MKYLLVFANYSFNDCISSHKGWIWDLNGTLTSTVYKIKVWRHANRDGASHTFQNGKSRYDDNWIDEHFGFPDYSTINDKVSSIEIYFRVE